MLENYTYQSYEDQYYQSGTIGLFKNELYRYIGYSLKGDYTYKGFITHAQLGLLPVNMRLSQYTDKHTGGGSSPSYIEKIIYNSTVQLNYGSLRFGLGYVYEDYSVKFPNRSIGIGMNLFLQQDFLISYKEKDHEKLKVVQTNNNPQHEWHTIQYPPDSSVFKSLIVSPSLLMPGINVFIRLKAKMLLFEFGYWGTFAFRARTSLYYGESKDGYYSDPALNTGMINSAYLQVGYVFDKKMK